LLELHIPSQLSDFLADRTWENIFLKGVDILHEDQILRTFEAEGVHTPELDRVRCNLDAFIAYKDLFHLFYFIL
jgi:hypothetical protein